jgi:hypothetical protein
LCDRCYVISFESNTPLQTKNFTLTAEGAPQPSCPGCLRPASADLHEHTCDEVNASFVTGLNSCPICEERLDVAPAFPSRVADYLKRTRSANKVNVTFDYETGAFVPVEDGEFVVVTNTDQPIVLPRTPKFSTKRDFYEFYQDYYHCPNPDAGDIQIIHPAVVSRTADGWTLQATGVLDVLKEQPKKKTVAPAVQPPIVRREEVVEPEPKPVPTPVQKEQPGARACTECGASIEAKYAFCWKCGHSMDEQGNSAVSNKRNPGTLMSSAPIELEDEELTIQHETRPAGSTMFSWTNGNTPQRRTTTSRGSVLKLLAIGATTLLLVSLGTFWLFRSETQTVSANVAQPVAQPVQPVQPAQPATYTTEVSRSAPAETTMQQVAPATPDDELKKLREKGKSASDSERSKIVQAFAKVEKQYPRDYRFPYERAKVVVKGSKRDSRKEAFKALNVAAEKAITTGKANEMLSGLETDKSGDFSELSQGRDKWGRLVAALKRKDTSLLSE